MLDLTFCWDKVHLVSHGSRQAPSHQWRQITHLQSISLPVFASLTMSLTQGGGVMGRRSCPGVSGHGWLVESPPSNPGRRAYLVAKPTHARTLWLLHNIKAAGARISLWPWDRRRVA